MSKSKPPWWELFLKYWQPLFAMGGLLIGGIVFLATLNPRVIAAEKKNELQDSAIIELKKSNEVWQEIYQQQKQRPQPAVWIEEDERGRLVCSDGQETWRYDSTQGCE